MGRMIPTGCFALIAVGLMILWVVSIAPAQSSSDMQRQVDRITADLRDLQGQVREIERQREAASKERAITAQAGFERLAAVEREIEWTRWIVRANAGIGGGVLGVLVFIWRRLNGQQSPWREKE